MIKFIVAFSLATLAIQANAMVDLSPSLKSVELRDYTENPAMCATVGFVYKNKPDVITICAEPNGKEWAEGNYDFVLANVGTSGIERDLSSITTLTNWLDFDTMHWVEVNKEELLRDSETN